MPRSSARTGRTSFTKSIVAMNYGATVYDFLKIPHLHPTMAEIWTYPRRDHRGRDRVRQGRQGRRVKLAIVQSKPRKGDRVANLADTGRAFAQLARNDRARPDRPARGSPDGLLPRGRASTISRATRRPSRARSQAFGTRAAPATDRSTSPSVSTRTPAGRTTTRRSTSRSRRTAIASRTCTARCSCRRTASSTRSGSSRAAGGSRCSTRASAGWRS